MGPWAVFKKTPHGGMEFPLRLAPESDITVGNVFAPEFCSACVPWSGFAHANPSAQCGRQNLSWTLVFPSLKLTQHCLLLPYFENGRKRYNGARQARGSWSGMCERPLKEKLNIFPHLLSELTCLSNHQNP